MTVASRAPVLYRLKPINVSVITEGNNNDTTSTHGDTRATRLTGYRPVGAGRCHRLEHVPGYVAHRHGVRLGLGPPTVRLLLLWLRLLLLSSGYHDGLCISVSTHGCTLPKKQPAPLLLYTVLERRRAISQLSHECPEYAKQKQEREEEKTEV